MKRLIFYQLEPYTMNFNELEFGRACYMATTTVNAISQLAYETLFKSICPARNSFRRSDLSNGSSPI